MSEIWKKWKLNLATGVWVLIFAIIPITIVLGLVYLFRWGLSGFEIGMAIIVATGGIVFILYLIISGWAARQGVSKVRR